MFSDAHYDAAHRAAVVDDRSLRGTIELTGSARLSFLHALLTNDIASLAAGTGAYAAYLTPQGRMISDMRVIETGDRVWLGVQHDLAAPLAARFDRLIFSEDVRVRDLSDALTEIGVHGPDAGARAEKLFGLSVEALRNQYDNLTGRFTIVRDDELGVPGFGLYVPTASVADVLAKLVDSGAFRADDETLESLRIEAGRPRFGIDMSTDTIPLEAGIEDRAISLTKGCYVGQEVIVRVLHRGHGRVARRLVRLAVSGDRIPSRGEVVSAGDKAVGEITSAAFSPKIGAPMAMAYVAREYAPAETMLAVSGSAARVM